MAVKTVNVQSFDAAMALGRTAEVKQNANRSSENFGEVLNKASDKIADKNQTPVQNAEQEKPESDTSSEKTEELKENPKLAESAEETKDSSDAAQEAVDNTEETEMPDEKQPVLETIEAPDEITTEQIADALAQIMEQIKELLGISDEELLAGMESIGIQPADLLNTENMAQLLTAIAGEGEAISFVTNEDLYAALQEMTAAVENVSSQLLEDTGLTQEELYAVLGKMAQTESPVQEEPVQSMDFSEEPKTTDAVNKDAVLPQEEVTPVVVEENRTLSQEKEAPKNEPTQKQYEELPENQQENPTDKILKLQSQKPEQDANRQEKSDDFSRQQGTAQNFGENAETFKETAQVTAETAVSYTSQNVESIIKQLADFVKIIRNENLTEMELQLHPASLGTVNVSLVTKGGAVTAEFTTQNEAVRAAIESQVSQLVTNLEEQGVKIEAVEVSVESHEMERNLEDSSQNDQSRQEQEEKQRVSGTRRNSINFNSFADGDEIAEEMQGADDATRIAMELMAANGNSMDLMA